MDLLLHTKGYFADVILPLALPELYTYSIPDEYVEKIHPGQRVVVQFGKQKIYAALVHELHHEAPQGYQVKPIIAIIDEAPVVTSKQLKLWHWMSDYYLCTLGEIMLAALPAVLRMQSETIIVLKEETESDPSLLTDREYLVWEALTLKKELTIRDITQILSMKYVMPVVRSLIIKDLAFIREEVIDKYKPRFAELISLNPEFDNDESLAAWIAKLEKRAPKQLDLLLGYLHESREQGLTEIPRSLLLKKTGSDAAALKSLITKKIFITVRRQEGRAVPFKGELIAPRELNRWQQQSLSEVQAAFDESKPVLLHGVTSSGKTEIYIHLINDMITAGKQVLYLLPEIALTTQIIERLRRFFGNKVLVYHSRYNDQERAEVWTRLLAMEFQSADDSGCLVIGARSSMHLPYTKLGLVIVDEEHDPSYKQDDPAPRYNARDTAIVLANSFNAGVLLGSATPAMESYFNANSGKYALVSLDKRHAELEMPEVSIIDMKDARRRKLATGSFSKILLDHIEAAISNKQQVILFQNRRGFAPFLECQQCSWVPHCINCDVSLSYHKLKNELRCHYCGFHSDVPFACEACGHHDIRMRGFGTERIEEELQLLLPHASIARLDLDTTRSKHSYQRIISGFEEGAIDVLVGTQMITKGLDFDRVSLVGIINADSLLHYPDFRSNERCFQLLEQVSGRAGRKTENGQVLIQTYDPKHAVLQFVLNHDYKGYFQSELVERYKFHYPPYYRLIGIRIRHRLPEEADRTSKELAAELNVMFANRVMGPTIPYVSRVRNLYIRHLMLKLEKTLSISDVKQRLMKTLTAFRKKQENKQVMIQVDVDPF